MRTEASGGAQRRRTERASGGSRLRTLGAQRGEEAAQLRRWQPATEGGRQGLAEEEGEGSPGQRKGSALKPKPSADPRRAREEKGSRGRQHAAWRRQEGAAGIPVLQVRRLRLEAEAASVQPPRPAGRARWLFF